LLGFKKVFFANRLIVWRNLVVFFKGAHI